MEVYSNNITIHGKVNSESGLPIRVESSHPVIRVAATSSDGRTVPMTVSNNAETLTVETSVGITVIEIEGEPYTGSYRVDPTFVQQILLTRNKILTDNVNVAPIEVQRVSNLSGGKTIYIGGNINA